MNLLEEAIIYSTITPYILHPLEVAQILSGMTDDKSTDQCF